LELILKSGFLVVRARAIRPTVHLELLDANGRSHLKDFAPVVTQHHPRVVFRIVRPTRQQAA
jgi:hypothetical protein